MDYLSRADDLEEVRDQYYQIIYDLIMTKIDKHFQQYHSAPRYLLAGESKLWEISRIMFKLLGEDPRYTHYSQIYKELISSSDAEFYGMKIIFVGNNLTMLEVA